MLPASEVKAGMVLSIDQSLYKVLSAEYHMGGGKMGGLVHVKLEEIRSGLLMERKFKPDEKLKEVELDRKTLEFLYEDSEGVVMMDPESFEQITLPKALMESFSPFLQPNMRFPVEFLEEEPVHIIFPEWVELEVVSTPPSLSSLPDEVYKPATLSNGMQIQVPQFIKEKDVVKVSVATKKYLERVKR
ncbi:MAG: elongation factor P [Desulfobacterota bacterium]|nr:elongation factor P [Thermodesulfobacteriota bacterium]